jgi:hypothetical protein
MKKISGVNKFARCCVLGLSVLFGATSIAQRINDFALLDQDGNFFQLSYYKDSKALALLVLPKNEQGDILSRYQSLAAQTASNDVVFAIINPDRVDDRQIFQHRLSQRGITLPVLIDDTGLVADLLAISRYGEVLLIDPTRLNILYRGTVGEALQNTVAAIATNKTVSTSQTLLSELPAIQANSIHRGKVSYTKDVVPILTKHCLACHREQGVAPFAMDSWGVVLGWSPMIKEVLLTKRMPPGQIDPKVGHFDNGRVLDSEDIRKLVAWIDAGGENDSDEDPLQSFTWPAADWAFGEPDLILELPQQAIPATGLIDYTDLILPVPLDEDVWVRATQFVPGDRRVLHHAEAFVIAPGVSDDSNLSPKALIANNFLNAYSNQNNPNVALIAPYVPGADPLAVPLNTGGMIKQNSHLAIQLHYAAIGREVTDKTRLGLWFYKENQIPKDRMVMACTCLEKSQWQTIPAYQENFITRAELVIDNNVQLYQILPQLHYRGSAIRFDAHLPTGEVEAILNVPKYNYNWQIDYRFSEPKFLPAGTKIVATATYDNSNKNNFNPDASQDVPWGRESYNEILAGVLQWKEVD